jgi:hypothetical protein
VSSVSPARSAITFSTPDTGDQLSILGSLNI